MTLFTAFIIFAALCLILSNGFLANALRRATRSLALSRGNMFEQWGELSRCQKANAALRERVGNQKHQLLAERSKVKRLELQLRDAQAAAQQPLPVDPDHEPTFAEIVQEVASHVSSLTTSVPVIENGTAPEPVGQVVAGTVVTTPDHTSLDLCIDPDTGDSTEC